MNPLPANFTYQNTKLFCEGVDVENTAQKQGSPLYIYSYKTFVEQYRSLTDAFADACPLVCFSVKSNPNAAVLKTFFLQGAGADVVSGGELLRALKAGCDPQKIVFSGVGKTSEEIHLALNEDIFQFNVESEQELVNIQRVAAFLDKPANVALRVNPDVDAKTHPYISTGLKENKFGVSHKQAIEICKKALTMSHIRIQGIACHIGSQITEAEPFHDAMELLRNLILQLRQEGISLKTVDVGGGLGISYHNESVVHVNDYAQAIWQPLKDLGLKLLLEPGRFLTAAAGILVTKILYLKKSEEGRHFTIVDAGFNDLMRPMLYQAYHHIIPVLQKSNRVNVTTDIVGPICETTDTFAHNRTITLSGPGEFLAITHTGAYGASMASQYNSRGRPCEVMVKDKMFYVIKKPDRLEDIIAKEVVPEFLKHQDV